MMPVRRHRVSSAVFAAAAAIAISAAPGAAAQTLFVGDYSTGDFSQWPTVQARGYNDTGRDFVGDYSARVVADSIKGKAARFEVRPGDRPPFGGGERSEVQGGAATGGAEGQTRWYQFSTMFDGSFPMNHADLGWGVTNQWHAYAGGSPPVSWTVDMKNGHWSLTIEKQAAPGDYLEQFSIFDTPLDVGQWHDVAMQIHWSPADDEGWIQLWHNGARQVFSDGTDTYRVRTLIPGANTVYYKEGMYREPSDSTDIVYHAGFRSSDTGPLR